MRHLAPALLWVCLLVLGLSCLPTKRSCTLHSDCSEVERCVSGTCTIVCRTDRDCEGKGGRCVQGGCVGEPDGGAGGGDAGSGGGTGGGDAGSGSSTGGGSGGGATGGGSGGGAMGGGSGGGPTGGGFGGGTGRYGALCQKGSDCLSGYCVANVILGTSICTMECPSEAVCFQGHACLTVGKPGGGTVNVCVPSDSGQPCPTGQGTSCEAGICLVHPTDVTRSVCATPCDSSRACPTDFSCSLVSTGAGSQRLCTPVAKPCTSGGASTECITRWCSVRSLAPTDGICTNNCRTAADCPAGWACDLENDTPTTLISSCHPVGEPCTSNGAGANDCYSGSCATTSGLNGYCSAFCMNATSRAPEPARCPQGFSCSPTVLGTSTVYFCSRP